MYVYLNISRGMRTFQNFKLIVKEYQSVQIKQRKNSIFTDTHQKISLHLDIRPSAQVLR
jgi:hypothetical protein